MDKKSIVDNLYQVAVISIFAICYSVLEKKTLKMTPSRVQEFDMNNMGKQVATVSASEMMQE